MKTEVIVKVGVQKLLSITPSWSHPSLWVRDDSCERHCLGSFRRQVETLYFVVAGILSTRFKIKGELD